MATYYARNVTGNWSSNTSWDSASSGGAGPAGPPVAGDTAIFDSGFTGNISVAAAAACTTLTVQAGATGTLTISASQTLTVSGNITFVSGFTLAGTGTLRPNATGTITSGGLTHPWSVRFNNPGTFTLADALTVTGTITFTSATVMAGAFDITCGSFVMSGSDATSQLVSGQTLTVTTSMIIKAAGESGVTLRAVTTSSVAYLNYGGTPANCKVSGAIFTDIDASGSAQGIDNWYGGTLTRTTGITNRTSADIGGGTHGTIIGG